MTIIPLSVQYITATLNTTFLSREECEAQVTAYPGAKHKKLRTFEEAVEWLAPFGVTPVVNESNPPSTSSSRTASTVSSTATATSTNIPSAATAGPSRSSYRATLRAQRTATKPTPVDGTRIVYCDGACKGNGQTGSIAGVGVYWGVGDSRQVSPVEPSSLTDHCKEETSPSGVLARRRIIVQS